MSSELLITIGMFTSMILVLFSGIPLIFGLGTLAIIWAIAVAGPQFVYIIPSFFFVTATKELLMAIAFFVFMGNMLVYSGVGDELFGMVHVWFGGVRGGLAMGTIAASAVFAACTGIVSASVMTLGLIALPAMLHRNYDKRIALGTVAVGSGLGVLIPPSVPMIIYASLTQVSVGAMFFGGVFPGLLLAALYILYIGIRSALQPNLCPSLPKELRVSWKAKVAGLRALVLPVVLILIVLGAIYTGVCTPTEAGAIGAFGALIIVIIRRRFTWAILRDAAYRSGQLVAFAIWIIVAATVFNAVYTATGATALVGKVVTGLPVSRWLSIVIMQLIIFACGMIMDELAMLILLTPMLVPIVVSLGFSPLWFGVLFIVNIQMAFLTPPYGFILFLMRPILPKGSGFGMRDLYGSVWPFVALQGLGLILFMAVPQIILWLPQNMIK